MQRTNEQATKRYFTAIWSIFVTMLVTMIVLVLVVDKPVPDLAFGFAVIVSTIGAGLIGFIHGITIFIARQKDEDERKRDTSQRLTELAEQLPCLVVNCDDEDCFYLHDAERDLT